jgi:hypothetical protein
MQLRALKAGEKIYKVAHQHGLYAAVTPSGAESFQYDYRPNDRRETLADLTAEASQSRTALHGARADSFPPFQGMAPHLDRTDDDDNRGATIRATRRRTRISPPAISDLGGNRCRST